MPRVVVVAREAGAAAALVPVAAELSHRGESPLLVAAGPAVDVFARAELQYALDVPEPDVDAAARVLEQARAQALLTGTSLHAAADAIWWQAARRTGVPAVALVDHWHTLVERFSCVLPFDVVPDVIAVADDATRRALVDAGAFDTAVVVTGHPHLDALPPLTDEERRRARGMLGVGAERLVVVFASEPIAHHHGRALGYTEADSLAALREALATALPGALVVVRPHPAEDAAAVALVAAQPGPETLLDSASAPRESIAAADLVAGMRSSFLLEAARLGVPSISIRPGGREDVFVATHEREIASATSSAEAASSLRAALESRSRVRAPTGGLPPARRLVSLLQELVDRAAT